MKKRSVLLVAVLLVLAVPVFAQTPNDFKIDLYKDAYWGRDCITITGYTGNATRVVIPAEIEGIFVGAIGGSAFRNNKNITAVVIPASVTTINDGAITTSDGAFSGCSNLSSVTFQRNMDGDGTLTKIGKSAFARCSSLTAITFLDNLTTIGSSAFADTGLTSVTIPDSVTSIGDFAFAGCKNLTSINIPNGVRTIARNTFQECIKLTSITIPDGVTAIGFGAFKDCNGLVSISLPKSIKTIESDAFLNCSNLTTVTIEDGAEIRFVSGYYGDYTHFRGCGKLDIRSQLALKRAGYRGDF
jgi:hypothetical protein